MIEIEQTEDGLYSIRLTGVVLEDIAEAATNSNCSRKRIIEGCLRFGIAFLMYLFED